MSVPSFKLATGASIPAVGMDLKLAFFDGMLTLLLAGLGAFAYTLMMSTAVG